MIHVTTAEYEAACRALGVRQLFAIDTASAARKAAEIEWFKITKLRRRKELN